MSEKKGRGRFPRHDDLDRIVGLRHLHGGAGGPPFRGGPFGGGRGRARRGDVRLALLLLLAEEPRNGYQLMQAIEERSGGRWRASPGSVYPTLALLEDEGLVRASDGEGPKRLEVTDAGREHLEGRAGDATPWDAADGPGADTFDQLRSLIAQVAQAAMEVAHVGDERQTERACASLAESRRALYRILAEDPDA